jgi:hypothetical protein
MVEGEPVDQSNRRSSSLYSVEQVAIVDEASQERFIEERRLRGYFSVGEKPKRLAIQCRVQDKTRSKRVWTTVGCFSPMVIFLAV